jgi:hypothetical protein
MAFWYIIGHFFSDLVCCTMTSGNPALTAAFIDAKT